MLALREGLTWLDRWVDPQEGPYTHLAKIAMANRVPRWKLMDHIFGVRATSHQDSRGLHCRTFIQAGWMPKGGRVREGGLATDLASRALSAIFGDRASDFASDEHFRYCPICLDGGFQSSLCQVDALISCPMHRVPLLKTCRRCQHPTARYAFDAAFRRPMQCTKCEQPLGRAWSEDAAASWHFAPDTGEYAVLANLLRNVSRLTWLDRTSWDDHFDLLDPVQRRIANLAFSLDALACPVPRELFHEAIGRNSTLRLNAEWACTPRRYTPCNYAFADVCRRLAARLEAERFHRVWLDETVKISLVRRTTEWVGSADQAVLSFILWRNRFSTPCTLDKSGVLKRNLFGWAKDLALSEGQWTKFFLFAHQAEANFASRWCCLTGNLTRRDQEWRELMSTHSAILGADRSSSPQSMGLMSVHGTSSPGGGTAEGPILACGLGSEYFQLRWPLEEGTTGRRPSWTKSPWPLAPPSTPV